MPSSMSTRFGTACPSDWCALSWTSSSAMTPWRSSRARSVLHVTSDLVHARVIDHLARLHLAHVAERIDAMLSDAAKKDVTYLDFLDGLLSEEVASKQRKRIAMHVQIANFPV